MADYTRKAEPCPQCRSRDTHPEENPAWARCERCDTVWKRDAQEAPPTKPES